MILNDIQEKLSAIDHNLFYGTAAKLGRDQPWDYTVFRRQSLRRTGRNTGLSDCIAVAIVREEYIPDGLPEQVIEAVEGIPGVRLRDGEFEYQYRVKPGTSDTVEMVVLEFTRARKK